MTEKVPKEIMTGNSPNLARDVNLQIQQAEQIPKGMISKKSMSRHTRIKLKTEDKVLKVREKYDTLTIMRRN